MIICALLLMPMTNPLATADAPSARIPIVLDSDANNELDDQHAIAYMLFSGDTFDVVGITINRTRFGGDVEEQAREAERVVALSGLRGKIPVVRGANGSFGEIVGSLETRGFDGADAVSFIVESAHRYGTPERPLVLAPIGKLTNVALALAKDPTIAPKVRVVWLGTNYPDPGEYNMENDTSAVNYVLDADVHFEIAVVRYGKEGGTAAVTASLEEIRRRMPGLGPRVAESVTGRNGGEFHNFGDYAINLFENIELQGDPPSRALYDMAALAIIKNPAWARRSEIRAPYLNDGTWEERPDNPRRIVLWEDFDRAQIMADFYQTMEHYRLVATP